MRAARAAATSVLVVLALAAPGNASTVVRLSNEELAKRADVILRGRCVSKTSREASGGLIVSELKFEVAEFLKGGQPGQTAFTTLTLGGTVGGRSYAISGSASYAVDEEVVAFLDIPHPKTGCRHTIGLAQGKFSVREEENTKKKFVVRDLGGLRLVESSGRVESVATPSAEPRVYLEPFLQEIKGYLGKK